MRREFVAAHVLISQMGGPISKGQIIGRWFRGPFGDLGGSGRKLTNLSELDDVSVLIPELRNTLLKNPVTIPERRREPSKPIVHKGVWAFSPRATRSLESGDLTGGPMKFIKMNGYFACGRSWSGIHSVFELNE